MLSVLCSNCIGCNLECAETFKILLSASIEEKDKLVLKRVAFSGCKLTLTARLHISWKKV